MIIMMIIIMSNEFRQGQRGSWPNGAGAILAIVATIAQVAIMMMMMKKTVDDHFQGSYSYAA